MTHRLYVHPLAIRIWHWLNAAGFLAMILTGVQMRYAGEIGVMPFATAVRLHNWIGVALIANYGIWLLHYLTSPQIRCYLPDLNLRRYFANSARQLGYYCYGMVAGRPNPHRVGVTSKFNPMQLVLYLVVMVVLVPLQFASGVLLWDVRRFAAQIEFLGGVRVVDTVHVLIFIFFVAYVLLHPYLGTLGPTRTGQYKAMLTGYEEVEEEAAPTSAEGRP